MVNIYLRYQEKRLSFKCNLLIFFLVLVSLIGCVPKKKILLDNLVCYAPCWQKIQPGSTTSTEAIGIISEISFIDSPPTEIAQVPKNTYSYYSFMFLNSIHERGSSIAFYNDKVAYINFFIDNRYKIAELIDFYGTPELLSVISGVADSRWLQVSWIYLSQGIVFTHFDSNWRLKGESLNITPDMPVLTIYYFDPNSYDSIAKTPFFTPVKEEVIQESIQPWKGFGLVPYTLE